jgi:uncharacterized protein (TIGR03437 family)
MKKFSLGFLVILGSTLWAQPGGGPGGGSGDGIWTRNAAFGESETFDLCNGHQPQTGQYHHHINPICLRAQLNDNVVAVSTGRLGTAYTEKSSGWTHSPILGWAFDGYPIYGPYGYSDPTNSQSAIKRVQPSFQLRNITQRHTLPTWILPYLNVSQNLSTSQYGPDVSATYPLGRYTADYDYVAGSGDLDQYNGRFTVTPDYPTGTYAYFVTISNTDGSSLFPYIMNVQYYGTKTGGTAQTIASDAVDYFSNGALQQTASTDPRLATWYTKGAKQNAQAVSGFDPSAGASTTWPTNLPSGVTYNGGNSTPTPADVQRVRYDSGLVFVNSNNLPSYQIGPWFEATMTGGVFMNWPSSSSTQVQFSRTPAQAGTKVATGMGPVGIWVNGVAIFNTLDGGSYSNSAGSDQGGGGISVHATHLSSASSERGPLALGSLVSAYAEFTAVLATSTASTSSSSYPLALGGATVTVTDSKGTQTPAGILYASAGQVNYQMPSTVATGLGKVTISAGGASASGTVNIVATYPGLFRAATDGLAAAQTVTVNGSQQVLAAASTVNASGQAVATPINVTAGQVYLVLYGTGIGTASTTATIAGANATVVYSGPQSQYPGVDQVNLLLPASLAGKGKVSVVVTAAGKASSPVYVVIQ